MRVELLSVGVGVVCLGLAAGARADESFNLAGLPYRGRLQFVFTGASMVDNTGLTNGVNCLKREAAATVRREDLPARPRLLEAVLYVGGSLLDDPGSDYDTVNIFSTPGLSADDPGQRAAVEQAARDAADTSVMFRPPGAASAVPVSTAAGSSAVSVFYKPAGSNEQGNVAFYVSRIDVTSAILSQGNGTLAGTYTISELLADVCYGREAVCDNPPAPPTCPSVSAVHTNAAASFALLLIVEDDALPLRTIGVFEGLQQVTGTSRAVQLDLTNPISSPAAGRLAFYAIEGDLGLSSYNASTPPCEGSEFIRVDGFRTSGVNGLCLTDDDNPAGNIFNSTINVDPAASPPGAGCADVPPSRTECCGDGLCGVTGVDIDRFNISSALEPGSTQVRISYGTGSDRIGLAVVVAEVDVFEPELRTDTQIRVLNAVGGRVQLGGPVIYSIAVSNTGNVPATDVRVQMPAPPSTSGLTLLRTPAGAADFSTTTGGANGTGQIFLQGFDVPPGNIAEVRFQVVTGCDLVNRALEPSAQVSSAEVATFEVVAPSVSVHGPGIATCAGIDPDGPYTDRPIVVLDRELRGGGGCAAAGASGLSLLGALALALRARRRRGGGA